MKKRNLFTLGLLGVSMLFMTSCSDDEDEDTPLGPSLDVEETTTGSTGGEVTIQEGDVLIFAWDARRGDNDLETFRVSTSGVNAVSPIPNSYDGKTFPYDVENANDEIYVDTVGFDNAGNNLGMTTYKFTVEDDLGNSRSVTFDVTVEEATTTTDLSDPQPFTWHREGSEDGTGLDQFGLAWLSNTTTSAIVTIDEATKMVMLTNDDWLTINTKEELAAEIDGASAITQYTNVSVQEDGTYSDVLGVHHNDTYYILRVEEGDVDTGGSGTEVTIMGHYKE